MSLSIYHPPGGLSIDRGALKKSAIGFIINPDLNDSEVKPMDKLNVCMVKDSIPPENDGVANSVNNYDSNIK